VTFQAKEGGEGMQTFDKLLFAEEERKEKEEEVWLLTQMKRGRGVHEASEGGGKRALRITQEKREKGNKDLVADRNSEKNNLPKGVTRPKGHLDKDLWKDELSALA